ncbi:MAG: nucleotidyltransferase domain-containing protein [bacterium]|nr:nucleotidyltransferase domain-containing protein [bacterium]
MNKRLIEIANRRKEIILMYIFGSMTYGKIGALSDYDIAILVNKKVPYNYKYQVHSELCEALNTGKVDLVVLNSAPIELAYNIIYYSNW